MSTTQDKINLVTSWVSEIASVRNSGLFVLANAALMLWWAPVLFLVPSVCSLIVLVVVALIRHFVINRPSVCVPAPNTSVLITGCSSGFGKLAAVRFAGLGVRVYACVRKAADGDALLASAGASAAGNISVVLMDVTSDEQVAAAVATVTADLERRNLVLGTVINNAGYGLFGAMEKVSIEAFQRQMDTNVTGSLRVAKAFLPLLRTAAATSTSAGGPTARLVFLSSEGGTVSIPNEASYHASKFAVEALADGMRVELRPDSIDVVVVQPGGFRTSFLTTLADKSEEPDSPIAALMQKLNGVLPDPTPVVDVFVRAAFERVPLSRYRVGFDAVVMIGWFAAQADAVRDFAFKIVFRLVSSRK